MQLAHDEVGLKTLGPFCNLLSFGRLGQDTVTSWVRENRWLEGRSYSCAYPAVWAEYPRCLREEQKPPGKWQAVTVPMRLQWASGPGVKHHGWSSAAGGTGKSQSTGSSQRDDWELNWAKNKKWNELVSANKTKALWDGSFSPNQAPIWQSSVTKPRAARSLALRQRAQTERLQTPSQWAQKCRGNVPATEGWSTALRREEAQ